MLYYLPNDILKRDRQEGHSAFHICADSSGLFGNLARVYQIFFSNVTVTIKSFHDALLRRIVLTRVEFSEMESKIQICNTERHYDLSAETNATFQ